MEAGVLSGRGGFTLMEVLVATVLLGFTLMGVQAVLTDRLVRSVGLEDHRATAQQLVADRLAEVQNDPIYHGLDSRYAGTEDSVPGFPRFRRLTQVRQLTGYSLVTVRVVTPTQRDTVALTVAVGAP